MNGQTHKGAEMWCSAHAWHLLALLFCRSRCIHIWHYAKCVHALKLTRKMTHDFYMFKTHVGTQKKRTHLTYPWRIWETSYKTIRCWTFTSGMGSAIHSCTYPHLTMKCNYCAVCHTSDKYQTCTNHHTLVASNSTIKQ